MSDFRILDRASAAEVEEIRSGANAATLSLSDVGEAMLDNDALAQNAPPSRRCGQFSQAMLKSFVIG